MHGAISNTHISISKPKLAFVKDYYYHKMGGYLIVAQIVVDVRKRFIDMGMYELKQAKMDVKTSIVLQFLLRLSMWCHFNGM